MKSSELLQALQTALVAQMGEGAVLLADDPYHVLELLSAAPGGWGAILLDKRESTENKGVIVLRSHFALYVWQSRGLPAARGEKIPALVERCELVRDLVLALAFPAGPTSERAMYEGREPVVMPDGWPLNAYELNFSLRTTGVSLP